MDYILHNFNSFENHEAILIRDDKILDTGSFHFLKLVAVNPEIIDLQKNLLLPAFTDAHTHFVETARQPLTLNVSGCKTENDFYGKLLNYSDNYRALLKEFGLKAPLLWIKGFGWEKQYVENFPQINRYMLDKVFPDIPVSIASRDLHANLCNSLALEISGVNSENYNNEVEIGRFSDGSPNGFMF